MWVINLALATDQEWGRDLSPWLRHLEGHDSGHLVTKSRHRDRPVRSKQQSKGLEGLGSIFLLLYLTLGGLANPSGTE